jgi:hypothetical protein
MGRAYPGDDAARNGADRHRTPTKPRRPSAPTVLWSSEYHHANTVAVDAAGNVYFTERLSEGTSRVLKLPVQ